MDVLEECIKIVGEQQLKRSSQGQADRLRKKQSGSDELPSLVRDGRLFFLWCKSSIL